MQRRDAAAIENLGHSPIRLAAKLFTDSKEIAMENTLATGKWEGDFV
jgi:hypothetical protein